MKKIFLYATLICGLCSCGLDNYDAPTASLSGAIIDKETKENVPGQAQNGTKIRMYEFYNDEWSVQPNDSWVSQDGTFSNTAVFTGKYKILAEKLSQLMIIFLITSKLLSKAAIFVSLYINCLLTLLYITALDNIIFHLDRFLSQTLSSWSLSHEHSVISLGIILM